jgi:hypothetical protein
MVMVALILSGKIKDPGLVKDMLPKLAEKIGPDVLKTFDGFKSVTLMMKEDGSVIHMSLWENREKLDKLMQSDLGKMGMEIREKFFFEGPLNIEYYDVLMEIHTEAGVTASV